MHNEIPLPSRSIVARWIVPMVIVTGAVSALLLAGFEAIVPATAVRVAPVMTLAGGTAPVMAPTGGTAPRDAAATSPAPAPAASTRWVQAPGWIEPDPQAVVASALRDGIVEAVLVLEGDSVKKGAPVAQLESRSAALAHARAKAEFAKAEGDRARFLAMAADARAEEAQLPFRRAAAQARFAAAKDASERADRLGAEHAMGESEVVRLRNAMLEARADLEAIEPRASAIAASIKARDSEAAAATLVPQAMLDEAALMLERSTVTSPIDGVVLEVHAVPGQNLFAGDMALGRAIVTLYDPRKLRVRADVPLADAAGLSVGQRARVTVEVLPDRVFDGVVSRLVHKADIQKNTVGVKVTLLDPSPELKPEMLARVRIEVGGEPGASAAAGARSDESPARTGESAPTDASPARAGRATLVARADAMIGAGSERRAFVVTGLDRGRGRVEERRVRIDEASRAAPEGWLVVQSGLAVGDRVVLEPPASLGDGDAVRVEEVHHAAR